MPSHKAETLSGIDVLRREGCRRIAGSRVGLVTNHTGLDREGNATADLLHAAERVDLAALFGPEHGIRGLLDEHVADAADPATRLPVYSLYGARQKPTAEQVAEIDTFVFDIQDIGCRFYTYISTLGNVMEAAREYGKRLVVLDRPNPITGQILEGPLPDPDSLSFTAYHTIPVRHGLTIGEMAALFAAERYPGVDLEIVRCEGWDRGMWFDETGMLWTNPSPNMRSLTQAILYPGIGLLEMTNLSVGRGTDTPFEILGAPYLEPRHFAAEFRALDLPGVTAVPTYFTPRASKFEGERCGGLQFIVLDRTRFEPVRTGLAIASLLRRHSPDWDSSRLNVLLANRNIEAAVLEGVSPPKIEGIGSDTAAIGGIGDGAAAFAQRRLPYLLY